MCPHLPGGGCWKGLAELINLAEAVPPLALNPGPLAPHPKVRAAGELYVWQDGRVWACTSIAPLSPQGRC